MLGVARSDALSGDDDLIVVLIHVDGGHSHVGEIVRFASSIGQMHRDEEAREMWRRIYPALSEGGAGLIGAVTSRAEAQVMRLACLYALLDGRAIIGVLSTEEANRSACNQIHHNSHVTRSSVSGSQIQS
jgi:hypothetical protein